MAVYTHLGADDLDRLIGHYNVGDLVSAKGIAEGVSNSNWLIETTGPDGRGARYILTMYERRIDLNQLPFFLGLLDHLSAAGCPVPRTIHDRQGAAFRMVDGKTVALIEFLPGISLDHPTQAQAHSVGRALAGIHLASKDYASTRDNDLRPGDWRAMLAECGEDRLAGIDPSLPMLVWEYGTRLEQEWPKDLPQSIVHADLFPDNVLMLGDQVSGLIDFYFACNDITAYDLAVTHAAWCFAEGGRTFRPDIASSLMRGYESVRSLSDAERQALPLLAQGAAMRFLATRAYDWLHTPADALVTRKDPMSFARRMRYYREMGDQPFVI